jgi:molybdopterin converting factor subunit 1
VTVTVLLFASYAERLGKSSIGLEVPAGSTVRTVLDEIGRMPGAEALPQTPLIAVNRSYARAGDTVADGDEIAIIPPVAGG